MNAFANKSLRPPFIKIN